MEIAPLLRERLTHSGIAPTEVERLAGALEVVDFPSGHVFIQQGESGDVAFLLVDGAVSVTHNFQGQETEINRLQPGALFGVIALLDEEGRSASCRADGPVRAARVPHAAFVSLAEGEVTRTLALQHLLGQQLANDFLNLDRRLRDASAARDWFKSVDWNS